MVPEGFCCLWGRKCERFFETMNRKPENVTGYVTSGCYNAEKDERRGLAGEKRSPRFRGLLNS